MLRFYAGLIISLFFSISAFNQSPNLVTGKIVYKRSINGKTDYLEMLFNQEEFRYRLSKTAVFTSYAEYEKIEHEIEANDSLSNGEKIDLLNEKAPYGSFYRKINTPSRYVHSRTSNIQKTCICDTLYVSVAWELIDGEEEIEGIVCGKAQTIIEDGNKIQAYYAKTIPVAAAPFGFDGLPGLLIKLENLTKKGNGWELYDLAWPYTEASEANLNLCNGFKLITWEQEKKRYEGEYKKINEFMERLKRGEKLNIKDLYN